ncbi:hypothetical protein EAH89_26255 [Roseomonas nepalensis]|uniref:DUF3572 family protein n=2 Tax=Muricoccus nepalensis TaxID=1854500 RepID=A0A502F8I4_9PROT|nr:hypothetical protein EAH89_26255 [Roseomonas nepalensis]
MDPRTLERIGLALGRPTYDPLAICRALCATPTQATLVAATMGFLPSAAQAATIMRALGAPPPIHPLALCEVPSETKH